MPITQDQLSQILPGNQYIDNWLDSLNQTLPAYDITTVNRIAAFLGETYVESAGYTQLHENLNYRATSLMREWPNHFPTLAIATQYANKPEAIANRAYANRMGNGDEASGDGWRYCGRGLIQVTGRNNYQAFANSVGMNIDDVPDYLLTFTGAVTSACWFWQNNDLNHLADAWNIDTISIRISGGTNSLIEREQQCNKAQQILGAS